MVRITLDEAAVRRLMTDPTLEDWRDGLLGPRWPILRHYHRHTTREPDGSVTTRGNFFLLTSIDPREADDTEGFTVQSVTLPGGRSILVGGDPSVMRNDFAIGWSNEMFTWRVKAR